MSAEGAARPTPYGQVFAHAIFEGEYFPAIVTEAERRGTDTRDFEQFLRLEEVGTLLGRLVPAAERGGHPSAAAVAQHAKLLYQALHHWREGARVYAVEPEVARALLATNPAPVTGALSVPVASGYAQWPANLLWARVTREQAPEPVDGFFWTIGTSASGEWLDLLLVLGVRSGRPGLSLIDVNAPLHGGAPAEWEAAEGRAEADDFANILPGGELSGLHALVTTAEALKLAGRWFAYLAAHGDALEEEDGIVRVRAVRG